MKVFALWAVCLLSFAAAYPWPHSNTDSDFARPRHRDDWPHSRHNGRFAWKAPAPTDRRCPCPMLNTLSNHGYLPRNGLNITIEALVDGLKKGVNLAEDATRLVASKALTVSTTGNPETFNLDDLNKHGVIEHDGSLSRNDIFFGDNHSFNSTIWAQTASHFTKRTIDIDTVAKALEARLTAAKAANPEFTMSSGDMQASYIESALYLHVMSDRTGVTGVTKWVKILFEEERLPFEEGWRRPRVEITIPTILGLVVSLTVATSL